MKVTFLQYFCSQCRERCGDELSSRAHHNSFSDHSFQKKRKLQSQDGDHREKIRRAIRGDDSEEDFEHFSTPVDFCGGNRHTELVVKTFNMENAKEVRLGIVSLFKYQASDEFLT